MEKNQDTFQVLHHKNRAHRLVGSFFFRTFAAKIEYEH